jgi:hypothetical protein
MRKLAFVALGALIIGISSCTKDPEPTPPPTPNPKTELRLVVSDSTNHPVEGANVELYKNQTDFATRNPDARVQGIHYTGVDGRLLISSLEPITYWFYIEDKDKTMDNLGDVTSKTLVKGVTTQQVVVIK